MAYTQLCFLGPSLSYIAPHWLVLQCCEFPYLGTINQESVELTHFCLPSQVLSQHFGLRLFATHHFFGRFPRESTCFISLCTGFIFIGLLHVGYNVFLSLACAHFPLGLQFATLGIFNSISLSTSMLVSLYMLSFKVSSKLCSCGITFFLPQLCSVPVSLLIFSLYSLLKLSILFVHLLTSIHFIHMVLFQIVLILVCIFH